MYKKHIQILLLSGETMYLCHVLAQSHNALEDMEPNLDVRVRTTRFCSVILIISLHSFHNFLSNSPKLDKQGCSSISFFHYYARVHGTVKVCGIYWRHILWNTGAHCIRHLYVTILSSGFPTCIIPVNAIYFLMLKLTLMYSNIKAVSQVQSVNMSPVLFWTCEQRGYLMWSNWF